MNVIETERLTLRRPTWDDIDAVHAVLSAPAATRYWSTPPHSDIEQTRAWLASMIDAPQHHPDYLVEHQGCVIGKAGCWRLPEIGFIPHPDQWHRGSAREAVGAVIDRVFARHEVEAITADVDPRNAQASASSLRSASSGRAMESERSRELIEACCLQGVGTAPYLVRPRIVEGRDPNLVAGAPRLRWGRTTGGRWLQGCGPGTSHWQTSKGNRPPDGPLPHSRLSPSKPYARGASTRLHGPEFWRICA